MLASEPIGGRSRVTELPCYIITSPVCPGTGDIATPPVRPSRLVCALENALKYFLETLQVRAPCHGVCCIVFDIDGMLFEFFINFLNIEKKCKIFFSIVHVFFTFYAISNI